MIQEGLCTIRGRDAFALVGRALLAIGVLATLLAATGCDREPKQWLKATEAASVAAYEQYLAQYPKGAHADSAQSAITALKEGEAWTELSAAANGQAYERFLERFSNGKHVGEARAQLQALRQREADRLLSEAFRSNTQEAYEAFIAAYPQSERAGLVSARLRFRQFGEIHVSLSLETPPGTFMVSRRDGSIESFPGGTALSMELSSTLNGKAVKLSMQARYAGMKQAFAIFRGAEGICLAVDSRTGSYVRPCLEDYDPIAAPVPTTDREGLLAEWTFRQYASTTANRR
jgi:hypothetical protein